MSNVSVEYLVLRDNVEFSRLTAFKGGGAAISVTADAAVKWALSGKFAQNSDVNYLTDVIQPVLTIDGVRRPLGKYIPTDAYTEHDGMRPVVSLTAYDLTYLAMSSKIETRLHLAKGTLYTAAIQALLVESGIMDFFVEANTATLQADREDWEPGTDRLTIINALAAEINYNSIWMDGGGTVHCSAFRMCIVATGTASATKALAAAGPTAAAAGSQFVMLAADLLMVGAAVFLVTSGIAMLISAIRGVPMINTGTIQVPSMGELQAQVGGAGYARGTRSATPGWRWVGENGPELMRFTGGEAVYTAEQSRALISAQGGGATFVDNSQNIFKVDDIETYVAIKRMLENEKMTVRMGLARR